MRVNRFDAFGEMVLSRTDPCLAFIYRAIKRSCTQRPINGKHLLGGIVNKFTTALKYYRFIAND